MMVFLLSALLGENTKGNVAVLYNGNTQVNREALNFMGKQFKSHKSPYRFSAVASPGDVRAGDYDVVLVLNSGRSTGIDPVLAEFIASWPDKSKLVLISLRKGSSDITVESIPSSASPQGVDAVSAASRWEESGLFSFLGKSSDVLRMHEAWVNLVIELIDQKA